MYTEQHVSVAGNRIFGTAREGKKQPKYVCAKHRAAKKREDLAAVTFA